MKVIIAGSRNIKDYNSVKAAIWESKFDITEIVSGGAEGVDKLGMMYAFENGIDLVVYYPNWKKYGKSGGYKRNIEMAKHSDALIAVWDGRSKGTGHMIGIARDMGLKVFVWKI